MTILYPGPLVIGRPFMPNDAQVEEVAALLRQAVATTVSNNIYGAHWLKLIVNLNNAFPALINTAFHQVYADPYLRQLVVQVMREGLRVAKQAGIRLESLPDTSARLPAWLTWCITSSKLDNFGRLRPFEPRSAPKHVPCVPYDDEPKRR